MSSSAPILLSNDKPKSCPWAKLPEKKIIYSLEEVMSEQLASTLQEEENPSKLTPSFQSPNKDDEFKIPEELLENESTNTDNDLILAQLLQLEFDKEYDDSLKSRENHQNKNSRVSISYDNFKSVHPVDAKEEHDLNYLTKQDLTSSSESEDELTKITFKNGVSGKGENMISKHDLLLNYRHNASKVMNLFPPDFETGDGHGINMKLSNQVYNTLKNHSQAQKSRINRLHDKQDKSTNVMSLDPKTKLILFKLVNADILDSIGGVISTGKEATIFYSQGGKTQEILVPKECVAKGNLYVVNSRSTKTTLNEFKTREKYIADDYRFKDRFKHLNPQKIVRLWAEKEMHNLMKMRKFDIPCPDVVILKKHILIMSFIGNDNKPAPKLKDANLNEDDLKKAYEQCIQLIKDLYTKCNLVHADFNQFNLLWHENKVWVIDVSQSVEPLHPMGFEFLLRDCQNVYKFFTNRKLENVKTGEQIFMDVTGMKFKGEGEFFLSQIQKYSKDKQMELKLHVHENDKNQNIKQNDKDYNFDYFFELSMQRLKNKTNLDSQDLSADDEVDEDN
ncbi:unnamed protein product [Brachionus calyciflorus]|uniref:Serine/threonine-protein kinase RIO3 n=1 Tax=Brachionus calyciflorus TaxID=104777 RepID=A0A814E1S4_9BILA|nr:unnamed protein product [Brachionus calyciflorus]